MKSFRPYVIGLAVLVAFALAMVPLMPKTLAATADATYSGQCAVYKAQGCNELHASSAGSIIFDAGGTFTVAAADAMAFFTNLTATTTELNQLHSVTAGTTAASKALVVDANKNLDTLSTTTSVRAGTNGAQESCAWGSELLTLATGTTVTDTTANLLPANSVIKAVVGRVTTTITASCTGWELGDATTVARFTTNDTTLTANETQVGLIPWNGSITTTATGPTQASAAKVRVTCAGGNPGAGAIRIEVLACTYTAPTS